MKHIILAGPTASGKTELALALARQLGSEIISADSRQIYTDLTVGTAKPQGTWKDGHYLVENIPYHLVDFLPPDQTFDVFSFCEKSRALLAARPDKPFIFAGGTGMYLHALFIGIDKLPPASAALRAELTDFAEKNGREALHARLVQVDPVSAAQIPAQNIHRVIRALEICRLTGRPASEVKTGAFFQTEFPKDQALFVYLNWEKELLNERIIRRTQAMLDPMAEETRALLARGFAPDCAGLKSLGYPEILQWIGGKLTREETLEKIIIRTRQYAKRQRTWFNRYKNILRLDINRPQDFDPEKISKQIFQNL
ncbi:MAG: tRNA (adenosine(37)-N6)-dimethylallyltransferase MiaA [Elusimicrobiaceae bacterium]|nr:tRNA (adenosine(37)-N6)-dimethylallyltransferase MiaA [Elusimicrobiaceae bacterium]